MLCWARKCLYKVLLTSYEEKGMDRVGQKKLNKSYLGFVEGFVGFLGGWLFFLMN